MMVRKKLIQTFGSVLTKLKCLFLFLLMCFICNNNIFAADAAESPIPDDLKEYIAKNVVATQPDTDQFFKELKESIELGNWQFKYSIQSTDRGLIKVYKLGKYSLFLYENKQKDLRVATLQRVYSTSFRGEVITNVAIAKHGDEFSHSYTVN